MTPVGLRRDGRTGEVDVEPGYHASGHAAGPELVGFVKEVRPRLLIPVHTECPQRWQEELAGTGIRVVVPCLWPPVGRPGTPPTAVRLPFLGQEGHQGVDVPDCDLR